MSQGKLHYHFLGICGTAMAPVAIALHSRGNVVTGSDGACYPPMSRILREAGLTTREGYSPGNLPPDGIVVVGNALSRGNPELEAALDRNLPLVTLPDLVATEFLRGKRSLVIAGTHGKTTTTALVAHILRSLGRNPGWLVGGSSLDLPRSCAYDVGGEFVIEGDEYDTAWFDKRPKFLHYRPFHAILTSLEFDHSDIYPDITALESAFRRFAGLLPRSGRLVFCSDDLRLGRVVEAAHATPVAYGYGESADYRLCDPLVTAAGSSAILRHPDGRELRLQTCVPGRHNLLNATAALALVEAVGVDPESALGPIALFNGVERRLTHIPTGNGIALYDDFAHHPSAIRATLETLRSLHPKRPLWALVEPRSNTMVRRFFQHELAAALSIADRVFVAPLHREEQLPPDDRLDRTQLAADLASAGSSAFIASNLDDLEQGVTTDCPPDGIVVLLSNGSFGGLRDKLAQSLGRPANHHRSGVDL